ncbi:uncharacterized protein N7511_010482 [Penicillium nucicola]|uniref:uncharacterized protein n=1 Tax=Penicillium nucicola TaxID=1850975 RepID=UPI0025451B40|nr:uncharacterized protein N7511_010482 [Penicillium nucicola]KAJ5748786.1 hypothetical protein N7511_010482 [Penicillium nucicola]
MGMAWTPEADAQLLILIIDQLKAANFVLDTEALAVGMGPPNATGCNKRSIQHRLLTLRKLHARAPAAPTEDTSATTEDASAPTTPVKRKAGRPRKNTDSKRVKAEDTKATEPSVEDDDALFGIVADDKGAN